MKHGVNIVALQVSPAPYFFIPLFHYQYGGRANSWGGFYTNVAFKNVIFFPLRLHVVQCNMSCLPLEIPSVFGFLFHSDH